MTPDDAEAIAIRDEAPADVAAIAAVIDAAFTGHPHSDGGEAAIVARLRTADALTLSLVAARAGAIVGQAAFSPVTIDRAGTGGPAHTRWFGLGPVAVLPGEQHRGIGARLIRAGIDRLRDGGAAGCVVLGDPVYYARFGFAADAALTYPGPPPAYFQALVLNGPDAAGNVAYHPAFAEGQ